MTVSCKIKRHGAASAEDSPGKSSPGDGYKMLLPAKPLPGVRDAKPMANDVMANIAARSTVSPTVEGRITLRM
jgi:hypothetical protein